MFQSFEFPGEVDRKFSVYRLDLNDALVSGNKFYKLKPWLAKAQRHKKGLLSCGGAFSNHLHALAAAGKQHGIKTAGLVRGLEPGNLTQTLQECQQMGMQLIAISRSEYRHRYQNEFAERYLRELHFPAIWVPEGGTDEDAVIACQEIAELLNKAQVEQGVDAIWVAVGSGGTLAGIARALNPNTKIYAVPVMKYWHEVRQRVDGFLSSMQAARISWVEGAYGGFGRCNRNCLQTHIQLEKISGMLLDPVYTGKLMRRMLEYYENAEGQDNFPLMLHSGGLQGRRSIITEAVFSD